MATLIARKGKKTGKTHWTVQVVLDGRRPCISLGPVTKAQALQAKGYIESLASTRRGNLVISPTTADWLRDLADSFYCRLVDADLVDPRKTTEAEQPASSPTLGAFLESYVAKRSDVKASTALVYGHTNRCLVAYFGFNKPLADVNPADAKDWRRWLGQPKNAKELGKGGQGLADNTVRRRCSIARQFFNDAVERRLIAENPFARMKGVTVQPNRSKDYFVSREEADAVLNACPDAQWRLLFALSRYGGLRCPSEHLALRWRDIDWKDNRITIRASKTEHHQGQGIRIMPLFQELRPHLQAVLDELLLDFDPKAQRLSEQPVITRYRDSKTNLRTGLERIILAAGLKPWPKLFQNLRATRATEVADIPQVPAHAAAEWLGHSNTIADRHYRQVTEEHFARALQFCAANAQQQSAETGKTDGIDRNIEKQETPEVEESPIMNTCLVGDAGPALFQIHRETPLIPPNAAQKAAHSAHRMATSTW
jgi:integrase